MKNLLKGFLCLVVALCGLAIHSDAQTVELNGIGSSTVFVDLGLAASAPTSSQGLGATCLWTTNLSGIVVATDTTTGSSLADTGDALVAWTPSGGSCATISSSTQIWAYLQIDSVIGNRCLFNANLPAGSGCTIAYPTTNPAPADVIRTTEVPLNPMVASAINNQLVNVAGSDIRPEDAEFATAHALAPCGVPVAPGSQYLGLGYTNGSVIESFFGGNGLHLVDFALPSSYTVTPIGAAPVLIVQKSVGGPSIGFTATNITSATLASFLDGTLSFTQQANVPPVPSGGPVTVVLQEPMSGAYNTVEYDIANNAEQHTSQDVGVNQPTPQRNCSGSGVASNPMNIATASGGARQRAFEAGSFPALFDVFNSTTNTLGYGFWSVANFTELDTNPAFKYMMVDGIDPLHTSAVPFTGDIPTTAPELAAVSLANVANGSYPIWSILRFVTTTPIATTNASALSGAMQALVTVTPSRPDFVIPSTLTVVRSHRIPPIGSGLPITAADGHLGNIVGSFCTAPEAGGDVGGKIFTLMQDSLYCHNTPTPFGNTGQLQ